MEITTAMQNSVTIMQVNGVIDSSNYQAFQSKAEELITSGARFMLVDLTRAPFISSAGLRAIHSVFNQLRALHKDVDDDALRKRMSAGAYKSPYLKICGLSSEAKQVFEIGGFDVYIEVYNSPEDAVSSF